MEALMGRKNEKIKGRCEECNKKFDEVIKFKGRLLCRDCLCRDDEPEPVHAYSAIAWIEDRVIW
jgi:hypothetical protein